MGDLLDLGWNRRKVEGANFMASFSSPDPQNIHILSLEVQEERLVVTAQTTATRATCPLCAQESEKMHSHYWRVLADLPSSGLVVQWRLRVRRFRCENEACHRQIFVERLSHVAPVYARSWLRASTLLLQVAFVLGGRPGERLASQLAMPRSNDSLLRALRNVSVPDLGSPRILAVDDWALRKGHTYGSILVDLEKRTVLDVIESRDKQAVVTWLKKHSGIEVISRDRGGDYADAAREGAPGAIQIADRFHLAANLREYVDEIIRRRFSDIERVLAPSQSIV